MTDKERLEEIKNSHLRGIHSLFGTPWVSIPKENFDWLINRVEESAKERAEWEIEARTQYAINKRLKKEIKQYRQALREIKNTDTTKEVYRLWAEQALKGEYRK